MAEGQRSAAGAAASAAAAVGAAGAAGASEPSLLKRLGGAGRPGLPVCLITGFLGAGKTTLVNYILANSGGLRAAVFVNEFGSVDVDGALIRSRVDEDRVISLMNGCVCCQVNDDLAEQLSLLLRAKRDSIDAVIIETSGVCDPDPVLSTLRQIEDVDQVHLDSVVCVVDATTVADVDFGASDEARRQLAHADVLLLNKVDLLEPSAADEAERRLLSAHREEAAAAGATAGAGGAGGGASSSARGPEVLRTVRAEVDLAALLGLALGDDEGGGARPPPPKPPPPPPASVRAARLGPSPLKRQRRSPPPQPPTSPCAKATSSAAPASSSGAAAAKGGREGGGHRHGPGGFVSFAYRATKPFDPLLFEEWAESPPPGLLRAKGLLWMRGIPKYICFHLAGRRTNPFETLPGDEPPTGTEIVFIARWDAGVDAEGVAAALDRCLG